MKVDNFSTKPIDKIHVAFDSKTLESLIREGKLHASDFNCLDNSSKKSVWAVIRSVTVSTVRLS